MTHRFLLATAATIALAACEGVAERPNTPPVDPAASGQTWLCGREYVNQAWGYQRRGVVMDTAGNIWKYDFKGSPTALVNPWGPKDLSRMSEEELKLRYNGAMTTGAKVSSDEIAKHFPMIEQASQAKPTEPSPHGADMGQTILYCYTYDAASRTYGQVMLDNEGDWNSTNPSHAARTLAAWLSTRLGRLN